MRRFILIMCLLFIDELWWRSFSFFQFFSLLFMSFISFGGRGKLITLYWQRCAYVSEASTPSALKSIDVWRQGKNDLLRDGCYGCCKCCDYHLPTYRPGILASLLFLCVFRYWKTCFVVRPAAQRISFSIFFASRIKERSIIKRTTAAHVRGE